jgi:hypothetical protein
MTKAGATATPLQEGDNSFQKRRPWLEEREPKTVRGQFEDSGSQAALGFEGQPETVQRHFEDSSGVTEDTSRTVQGQIEDTSRTVQGQIEDTSRTVQGQVRGQLQRQFEDNSRDSSRTVLAAHFELSSLVKTRRIIVLYLAQKARDARGLTTDLVRVEDACKALSIKEFNWKKTVQRLSRQGWFEVRGFNGAGGSIYTFTVEAWVALREQLQRQFEDNFRDSSRTTPETTSETNTPLSSCSEEENTKTTTTGADFSSWDEIDLSPLIELGMKIGSANVRSIARLNSVTPEEFQDAVHMFAFDLRANGKRRQIEGDVVAFFMGILRRGPYLPPQNYKSPQMERREAYLEWKRREVEQKHLLENEILEVEFRSWWDSLPAEERAAYEPDSVGAVGSPFGSELHLKCVKEQIFLKTVGPTLQMTQSEGSTKV